MNIRTIIVNLFVCISLPFVFSCDSATNTTGTIQGKVIDSLKQELISMARISLTPGNQEIFTQDDGEFIFESLPYGNYLLHANKEGFKSCSVDVKLNVPVFNRDLLLIHEDADSVYGEFYEYIYDYNNNEYPVIKIGNQYWMAENLKATHYSNGTAISYACPPNNDELLVNEYGRLYPWNSAMYYETYELAQGACPEGYHIPSDNEWQMLIDFLGGETLAGGLLKARGTKYWTSPNAVTNDTTGFNAKGTGHGYGYSCENTMLFGTHTMFWSSTEVDNGAKQVVLNNSSTAIYRHYNNDKENHFSIRCIKDNN